jgi:hypothetical protein
VIVVAFQAPAALSELAGSPDKRVVTGRIISRNRVNRGISDHITAALASTRLTALAFGKLVIS